MGNVTVMIFLYFGKYLYAVKVVGPYPTTFTAKNNQAFLSSEIMFTVCSKPREWTYAEEEYHMPT